MVGHGPEVPGRIFISYRRDETAYPAGWLFDRLADHFGETQIFKDIDSIEPGDDFVATITTAVGSCDVLLALIGDQWLTMADPGGHPRIEDPNDFVRVEIEAALSRDVRVIPILVEGARMPRADQLPASLANLVRRQALELSPSRFDADLGRLLRTLDKTLAEAQAQHALAASQPAARPPAADAAEPATSPGRPSRLAALRARLRPLVSTPRRIAVAAAVLLIVVVLAVTLATSDHPGSSNDGDTPSSDETPSDEGAPAPHTAFLATGTFVVADDL